MRFTYAESMTDPSFYPPLARAAEEVGYDSMVVPDSICYPRHATSRYPFSPDGSREFLEDKPFLEPFSLIPALGAVTRRLSFITFVLKLPVRDPLLVAKQATSTAVLTGGRLLLGVGASPWREDYEVLGVDWASRGQRMNESIAILRGLSAGGYFEYHGKVFDLPPVKISPVPPDPIPVLIGGHSDAALRRAARLGDGWLHGGGDPADLPGLLDRLARFRREQDTADRPFQVHVISADAYTADGVRRLEAQGVTDLIVGFRWPYVTGPDPEPLTAKLDALRRYADTIISKSRSLSRTAPPLPPAKPSPGSLAPWLPGPLAPPAAKRGRAESGASVRWSMAERANVYPLRRESPQKPPPQQSQPQGQPPQQPQPQGPPPQRPQQPQWSQPQPQAQPSQGPPPQEPLWREVLGRRLRALRLDQRETLSQTAARAGMSPQYLSEIERGRKEPSSEMIAALAGALGITLTGLTEEVASDLRRQLGAAAGRAANEAASGPVLLARAA